MGVESKNRATRSTNEIVIVLNSDCNDLPFSEILVITRTVWLSYFTYRCFIPFVTR